MDNYFMFGKPVAKMTSSNVSLDQMSYFTPDAVAELNFAADSCNRKAIRNLVDKLEKKYKVDIKKINDSCRDQLIQAEAEMREEISHFYMGSMYAMFVCAMKKAGLADRTVDRCLNYLAGTLNELERGEITISDVKDICEQDWGLKIVFDANRNMIGVNMFEEESNGEAEKKDKGKLG